METTLFELPEFPNRIAISKAKDYQINGTFFLDFSKPLRTLRWFAKLNWTFGIDVGLQVPVIHQAENNGQLVVGCNYSDRNYKVIKKLWKLHYPAANPIVDKEVDGINLMVDFAKQFEADC